MPMQRSRSVARSTIAAVLIAALGGCSLAPAYHPPVTQVAESYKEDGPWRAASPSDD
jgi:multidrug efflux system outer membrane protein